MRSFEWLKHKRWAGRDLNREIQGHLEFEAEDQLALGLPEEARRAANRALGNVMYVQGEHARNVGLGLVRKTDAGS